MKFLAETAARIIVWIGYALQTNAQWCRRLVGRFGKCTCTRQSPLRRMRTPPCVRPSTAQYLLLRNIEKRKRKARGKWGEKLEGFFGAQVRHDKPQLIVR